MTPEDIKLQLMAVLPRYTTEYCDTVSASAVVDSGAISIASPSHGLESGDLIVNSTSDISIPITGITYDSVSEQATIQTSFDHDRTSGTGDKGGGNVATLSGFTDSNYNGDFDIIEATRDTFTISASADVIGALGILEESRDIQLGFSEVTVVDDDNFTVPLEDTQIPDSTDFSDFVYTANQRICIAADDTRAVTMFGQRRDQEPTLYVIMGQEFASKDRNTVNDSVMAATAQNPVNLVYVASVSLLTIAQTNKQQSAETQQQKVYDEIVPAVRRAMYGFVFDIPDVNIVFAGIEADNAPVFYNQNTYLHVMNYQLPYRITIEQGYNNRRHVSFRDIVLNSKMFNNDGASVDFEAEIEV